jgi:hypothetical protein
VAEQVHPYNQTLHQMLHLYHWIPVRLLHFIMDIVDVFDGCYRCFSSLLECRHYIPLGSHIFYLFSDQFLFVRSKPLVILMTLEISSHLVIVFIVHNVQTLTSDTQQITLDFEQLTTLQSSLLLPFLLGKNVYCLGLKVHVCVYIYKVSIHFLGGEHRSHTTQRTLKDSNFPRGCMFLQAGQTVTKRAVLASYVARRVLWYFQGMKKELWGYEKLLSYLYGYR